jgi:hypothetical protein
MTSKQNAEQFNEEFNRADSELKTLQHELEDTLKINDNFTKGLEQKGEELTQKDQFLQTLREKNASELEQLNLEQSSASENSAHELNFHSVELHNLKIRFER